MSISFQLEGVFINGIKKKNAKQDILFTEHNTEKKTKIKMKLKSI